MGSGIVKGNFIARSDYMLVSKIIVLLFFVILNYVQNNRFLTYYVHSYFSNSFYAKVI